MTTGEFLLCLRRFASFYGTPSIIVSDNAKQFHTANRFVSELWRKCLNSKEVQEFSANAGIKWKFITELAPWMGGFYERLVSPVKKALKRCLGNKKVEKTELQTIVYEISSVLNSRPLVHQGNEVGGEALTPAHLLGRRLGDWPRIEDIGNDEDYECRPTTGSELIRQWRRIQAVLDTFWESWRKDYLLSLRERMWDHSHRNVSEMEPKVGTVVQISDALPRGKWRYGVITKLIVSADGLVRSVELRLANGKHITRAVKVLYPLEAQEGFEDQGEKNSSAEPETAPRQPKTVAEEPQQPARRVPRRKAAVSAEAAIRASFAEEEE
jgi:hypothetical protein